MHCKPMMAVLSIVLGAVLGVNSWGFSRQDTGRSQPVWEGQASDWHGFVKTSFEVDGRMAYVVAPKEPAPGNPWVWRARFPDFHAEADLILLERGFHIARIDTDGMLGSPRAMGHWNAFYQYLTERGLSDRCCLEGVSRGGLFVYGFASRWPERVACIYADTPVCDIRSWPGGKGTGLGDATTWEACLREYGLNEDTVAKFDQNPIDRLQPLVDARIPLLHIISMNDQVVPPEENTLILADRFRALGGSIELIRVEAGTEASHGHHFKHPDPLRVADFIERHALALPANSIAVVRGGLQRSHAAFSKGGECRVAFLGGSITAMSGWREMTRDWIQKKFPETRFEFIDAGIPSLGTIPDAFRLERDVLSKGRIDLLFIDAAVNDLHNMTDPTARIRGMEGVVRHALTQNPDADIVMMHFVDRPFLDSYAQGKVPAVIADHERVAEHYGIHSLHLAREVFTRIEARQFNWQDDFRDCHPSPFGHRLYASSIRKLLSSGWDPPPMAEAVRTNALPEPLDRFSYYAGQLVAIEHAEITKGFEKLSRCDPRDGDIGGSVREGFVEVPMLVGTDVGDEFTFPFRGRAVGLFVAAGPDAGTIEFSIDHGEWKQQDLFTKWSRGLHLPWAWVLADQLSAGDHELRVRIAASRHEASKGHAVRVVYLLVND